MKVSIGEYEKDVEVHIDEFDVWNLDSTLSHIILPSLKKLKEISHGSPKVDAEDVPYPLNLGGDLSDPNYPQRDLFMTEELKDEVWGMYEKRWNWVMDEMIHAFERIADRSLEDEYLFKSGDIHIERNKEWRRVYNGLRLFGKYYRGLWD